MYVHKYCTGTALVNEIVMNLSCGQDIIILMLPVSLSDSRKEQWYAHLEKCIKFTRLQNTGCIVQVDVYINSAGIKHYNNCCLHNCHAQHYSTENNSKKCALLEESERKRCAENSQKFHPYESPLITALADSSHSSLASCDCSGSVSSLLYCYGGRSSQSSIYLHPYPSIANGCDY